MKGHPAAVYGRCGKGRVCLISPHMEAENWTSRQSHAAFRNIFRLVNPKM